MKPAALLIALCFAFSLHGQDAYDTFAADIGRLKNVSEIKNYWENVLRADQRYRGVNAIDSNDCDNLVKTAQLIAMHGYPDPATYGQQLAFAPVLVMVHQNSIDAAAAMFPYLYQAYHDSLIQLDKLFYFLEGLHHSRFGQAFDRDRGPHKFDPKDITRLIGRLELDTLPGSSTQVVDILRKEKFARKNDSEVAVVGRWAKNTDDRFICYKKGNQHYLKLLHPDHSFSLPKVNLQQENGLMKITYTPSFYNDYFIINQVGNLEYYENGVFKKEYRKL